MHNYLNAQTSAFVLTIRAAKRWNDKKGMTNDHVLQSYMHHTREKRVKYSRKKEQKTDKQIRRNGKHTKKGVR